MTEYADEMVPRRLQPGQRAEVWIAEVGGGLAEPYARRRRPRVGHPHDLDVEVWSVRTANWRDCVWRSPLLGGQGTINVNSWSPDSQLFAFVAYPVQDA